jgi:glycosyltransferase involved in cell wall biosynthesis
MREDLMTKGRRVAAFGFRSIPPSSGAAGADKFALELFPRLVAKGYPVLAYNRLYPGQAAGSGSFQGVDVKYIPTVKKMGFDTLLHSARATWDILVRNTADIVHIQNGGNSIFALILRLFGKRVFLSQDGVDWKRDKWPWYGRLYLALSSGLTAVGPTKVVFDNVFAKELFEKRFPSAARRFDFIPFGSDSRDVAPDTAVLERLGLKRGEYFLFVGRFIPDKGLQHLVPAFEACPTDKKLVLVGGSPNPSPFESRIKSTKDARIIFPGFIYGADTTTLMRNAYAYVQPSDIEGLSPVILENMGLGTPVICSDIRENVYVVGDTALLFRKGDVENLSQVLQTALSSPDLLQANANRGRQRAEDQFSWRAVVDSHIRLFESS